MTIDTLRQVPLFESLDDEAAGELCHLPESIDCKAGAFLFRAGEKGDAMYLIEHGKVRICVRTTDGREMTLTELGRGDFHVARHALSLLWGSHLTSARPRLPPLRSRRVGIR